MYSLGVASRKRLEGVHPDLVKVVERAIEITEIDFTVTEGLRTLTRQKELLAAGASWTLRSRHLTGHAIDLAALVNGKARWDWPLYDKLALTMRKAAADVGIKIEWGGNWRGKKRDGPHFQLPWKEYP